MSTIHDVAKRARVSPATVSRVINQSGPVSKEARKRVQTAIAELGYVPNRLATSLRSSKTSLIALLAPIDLANPFWAQIVQGVEDAAGERGFHMILNNSDNAEAKEERILKSLLEKQVDGFILRPVNNQARPVELIQSQGVPVVVVDYQMPGVKVDIVRGDSEGGAYQLTKLLHDLGHQRIALLNGPSHVSVSKMRLEGYQCALREAGVETQPELILHDAFTFESGYRMAKKALRMVPGPTALVAASHNIALGTLKAIRDSGLQIPADISVVGFDEWSARLTDHPSLTVAEQAPYEIGQKAAELLIARISGQRSGEAQEIVLPSRVVYRNSCGPRPRV